MRSMRSRSTAKALVGDQGATGPSHAVGGLEDSEQPYSRLAAGNQQARHAMSKYVSGDGPRSSSAVSSVIQIRG
jgi:hypothetical protein